MSELLKQINSLAVFGGIRQREPLNSLCAFLRLSDTVGAAQTDVIEAYSEFIFSLMKRCAEEANGENVLISADSILPSLTMFSKGRR